MKKTFVTLAVLGVATAALSRARPALITREHTQCEDMMERMAGHCTPQQSTSCAESSCSGSPPGD